MLNLTETAAMHLADILSQAPDGVAVRFVPEENSLVPKLDNPRSGDAEFSHNGKIVLVLDREIAQSLAGKTLDVKAEKQGRKLVLV